MGSRGIAPLFLNLNTRSRWAVIFTTWVAVLSHKEPLLPKSVVGWVGYSGALDVLQKGKLPCPYLESNLDCPAITLTLSIVTEGVSIKLCVPELIKICHLQRLNLWQKGTMQENYFKVVYSMHFLYQCTSFISLPKCTVLIIYIYTHIHTYICTYILLLLLLLLYIWLV